MDDKTNIARTRADAPIVCTLTETDATEQALEWVDLQGRAVEVAAIDGGVRMTLPASLVDQVTDLAEREARCCAFLTINMSVADEILTLDISSPNPDAFPVISALTGIPIQ
jgi:hypothetical protein